MKRNRAHRLQLDVGVVDTSSMKNVFSKNLFWAFTFLLATPCALADGIVRSEVVLQLNESIFAAPEFDFSSLLQGSETFTLPDVSVGGEVPVNVSGVSASVNYVLQTASKTVVLGAEIPLQAKSLAVSLRISLLKVDTIVKKQVGDVQVNVRVQGQCEDIPVEIQGQASLFGAIRTVVDSQGLPAVHMPWVRTEWATDAWKIGAFNCSMGGSSFATQVSRGLSEYLSQASTQENVSEQLRSVVNARLASYQSQVRQWFLQPRSLATGIKGLSLTLTPKAVVAIKDANFQISATLDFVFRSSVVTALTEVPGPQRAELSRSSNYALALPKNLPEALSDMAFRAGFYSFRRAGQEVPAFVSLLNNGFKQFWVWPQLMLYSRNSPFYFDFNATMAPRLGTLSEFGKGSVGGTLAGALDVLTWAPTTETPTPKATRFIKMIRFSADIMSTFQLLIQPVSGGSNLKVSFSSPTLKLQAQWEAEYQRYLWYSRLGLDLLKEGLRSSLISDGVEFFLPNLAMTSQLVLGLERFGLQGDWLVIDLKPNLRAP